MPFDPNVFNYFLIVLGGFGFVWSFRHFSEHRHKKIGEFEYAGFSTLWGIGVFLLFMWLIRNYPDLPSFLATMNVTPMVATPILFAIGLTLGGIAGSILKTLEERPSVLGFAKKVKLLVLWWESENADSEDMLSLMIFPLIGGGISWVLSDSWVVGLTLFVAILAAAVSFKRIKNCTD